MIRVSVRAILSSLIPLIVAVATTPSLHAQTVDVTGTWQGTSSFTEVCDVGSNSFTSSLAAYFVQSGAQVTGNVLVTDFIFTDDECKPLVTAAYPVSVTGSISGTTFTGAVGSANGTSGFTGTVSQNTMTLTLTDPGFSGTITLTRSSSAPPSTALTGSASGSYSSTDKYDGCNNAISYSGSLTGTSSQTGPVLQVVVNASGVKFPQPDASGNCTAVDFGAFPFSLNAQISGNSVTGTLIAFGFLTFNGTISGNTISGTARTPQSDFGIDSTTTLTITVQPSGPNPGSPAVVVSDLPSGMLQPAGTAGATDKFSLTNNGNASTQITLSQTASFFTTSPATFTLQAGQTQVVTFTAKAQPAGSYDGAVAINGSGVAAGAAVTVRLFSVVPPTGAVNAAPTVARVDAVGAGDTSTGAVEFTNSGNDTLQGVLVADTKWILPQDSFLSIPPGGKKTINFTCDRTKRPDAAAPLGSLSGTLSLVFLTGSGASGAKPVPFASGASKTVSVSILDTVKSTVTNGTPAPLAAGELALFASGMRSSDRIVSDLTLVNRRSATVNDLKLFAAASATSFSKLINLPALTGDVPSAFAAIARNIFDINGPAAAVQIRGAQAESVQISPVQVSTPGGKASYATALPVLRSDAGAAAGQKLFLPGVEKSASLQTALNLQELTGNATTVQTEFLRGDGSVITSRSDSLPPFGFQELADAVPTGATSVRITNNSAGSRLAAYARVSDSTTGDAWTVIDPKAEFATTPGDLILPIFPSAAATSQRFIDVLNPGSASTSVRVQTVGGSERRRAVRARSIGGGGSSVGTVEASTDRTVNVGSQQTTRLTVDPITAGYVRLSASSPLVASGRLVLASATGGSFGTALTGIPVSAAIGINETRRFAGIFDAGPDSVDAATPGTYRSSLMLIEAAGQSAKVRVTLRFTLPGGTKTTGTASAQQEYSLAPSQQLLISDLGASIIGSQRTSFGDLRNMQIDVDVIDGGGRVVAAAAMADNSTGDLMVRVD